MFKPVKYDPTTAPDEDEGLFYNGDTIFSLHLYWEDDDVDYDGGYLGCLGIHYAPDVDHQYGDGLWTGYKRSRDCIKDEIGFENLYRIASDGYDCGTFGELWEEVMRYEGVDIFNSMTKVKEMIGEADEG